MLDDLMFRSSTVRIVDYRCRGHRRGLSDEERTLDYEIVLPRRGIFVRHVCGDAVVGDPNCALFFNAGESHRVSHPVEGGDECTGLAFPKERIRECLTFFGAGVYADGLRLFPVRQTSTSSTVDRIHRQLLRCAKGSDALLIDEISLDLLSWLVTTSLTTRGGGASSPRSEATRGRHSEIVLAAREQLSRRLGERLELSVLASSVGTSPFHLSRLFRAQTGRTLSEYHRGLRLRTALERIIQGEDDLTQLALELGFSHHSHFTNTFRKEFGLTPSGSRDSVSAPALRDQLHALLKDPHFRDWMRGRSSRRLNRE